MLVLRRSSGICRATHRQNTGDTAVDAALAANPDVAYDGILFAFKNTSGFAITGGRGVDDTSIFQFTGRLRFRWPRLLQTEAIG